MSDQGRQPEAADAGFIRVAAVDEVKEGRGRCVLFEDRKVALWLKKGRYYAFGDTCPHMGASLSEGFLRGETVVCHWHNWSFDMQSGACRKEGKEWAEVPVYEVRVDDRDILLRRPAPAASSEVEEDEPWMTWEPPEIPKKKLS